MKAPKYARTGTSVFFLMHGILVATWISRIPSVQSELHLSSGVLGFSLLAITMGSLIAMPVTGALIHRRGSRFCTAVTTAGLCIALTLIAPARDAFSLAGLLFMYGAAAGAMDVSMNAQGVLVERLYGRSIMSSFHALFSIGGMAGAALGGQAASAGMPVWSHFILMAAVCAVATFAFAPTLAAKEMEAPSKGNPTFALPRGPLIPLGALGFCILVCEGGIADWTAIYLRDALNAGPAAATAGYAVFSGAMAAGRLRGDWLTDRLGSAKIARWGASIAAAGLFSMLMSSSMSIAMVGLVAAGLGYAAIIPNVFSTAGRLPGIPSGAGIAAVTTMGFTGFLMGPPAIGWLAEWFTLRAALFVLVALSLAGALLAGALRTDSN